MVQIAVIGGGVAGLVASRHILRCGLRPVIFEKSRFRGGTWNINNKEQQKVWDNLTPNLSKYTCCFSDFPWNEDVPAFPSRTDLHEYIDRYATTFVDSDCFRYGCTVTKVKRSSNDKSNSHQYQVEWSGDNGESHSQEFDGVVVASGYFASPVLPEGIKLDEDSPDSIIHSSSYRSPSDFCNQTVAVIGASFSALEIAVDVRKQAKRVVNILPKIPWVLPRFVPASSDSNDDGYLPLDMVLYKRTIDAPQTEYTFMDEDACKRRHTKLRELVGTRKQSAVGIPSDATSPPMISISDDYLNFVADKKIEVVEGRLKQAAPHVGASTLNIELEDGNIISDVDSVIACTGYRSQLDFLENDILQTLEYEQTDAFSPLALCFDTIHPQLPGLGFVGMYKGPYFGVMELQARLVAETLSGNICLSDETTSNALEVSRRIRKQKPRAQFPHFDYVGVMDTLAKQLDLVPDKEFGAKGKIVSPCFYQGSEEISRSGLREIEDEVDSGKKGRNVARIALGALVGNWSFQRTITQFSSPSLAPQRVTGTINFSLKGSLLDTVLYREDGVLHLPNGRNLEVFREYEYITKDDTIEIYFVENGQRAHLFLSLKFEKKQNGYWVATSDHLCIKDLYKGKFEIALDGIGANGVTMTYRVKGPNKDYESVTHLQPL